MNLNEWSKKCNEKIGIVNDFRSFSIREDMRHKYRLSIEYDDFKKLLEQLLLHHKDLIIDYSIDINNNLYIQLDVNNDNDNDNDKKIKSFYEDFMKLLKTESYYVMSYISNDLEKYKKNISLEDFKNNSFLRIYLDKIYDVPIVLDSKYLYHVTLKDLWENDIRKNGLTPSNKKMVSDEPMGKIFLFKNILDCYDFINDRKDFLTNKKLYENEYFYYLNNHILWNRQINNKDVEKIYENVSIKFVILSVDIETVGPIKFYKDRKETQRDAYYTYDKIPYWSLKLEKEVQ